MFKLSSPDEVLAAFRPKDRSLVEFAPELRFPLIVRDYLGWQHPAGGRVFLVFAPQGAAPIGIAFDTNGGPAASVPQMCHWCHSAAGHDVALLTARLNANKRIGVHICSDLSCRQKLEDEANRTGRSVRPAMEKLVARIEQFARDGLKIDLLAPR